MTTMGAEYKQAAEAVETASVVVQVEIRVATKEAGGDLAAAAEEMVGLVTEYLSKEDSSFMTDYGASTAQIAQARVDDDWSEVTWGGFDGPYAVSADVRPAGDVLRERLVAAVADLNSDDSGVNREYLRGQLELAVQLLGYEDDGQDEKIALLDLVLAGGPFGLKNQYADGAALFDHIYSTQEKEGRA